MIMFPRLRERLVVSRMRHDFGLLYNLARLHVSEMLAKFLQGSIF